MAVDLKNKSFTLVNNYGTTFIAVFELTKVSSFKTEEEFQNFLKKYKK